MRIPVNKRDEEIISLIMAQDEQGMEFLYHKYSLYIYGFICQIIKLEDFAQIVLQDTFLKVWDNIDSFDIEKGVLLTWMIRIARNTAIDMIRSKNYSQMTRLVSLDNLHSNKKSTTNCISIDTIDVRSKIAKLDVKPRVILELIYFEGYTSSEVAKKLNIPLGTVKSRIRKGYKDLRKLMDY
jgi:RNA polymerase sigma factor, sigma-70 family